MNRKTKHIVVCCSLLVQFNSCCACVCCMLFGEFGARSIYAHSQLGSNHTEQMNQRTEPSAKYTHKQRNCQRNNVFKMIYSVVYVNIIESKDQRFGCMHRRNTVSVCLCYYISESNICVIYNAIENYFPFNFINNWGNQRTQFEFCRFQLFKYSFIAKESNANSSKKM